MTFNDDIRACAGLLERGDPVRFRAVMSAPLAVRAKLFPVFAFNLEVARAPWVTKEAMIAEMRLQWWHDALDEIALGETIRRHEVVTPLSKFITAEAARDLQSLIEARRWDIYPDPFVDEAAFLRYISQTSSNLLKVASQALGPAEAQTLEKFGFGVGLANFFVAVPQLLSVGRSPLFDETSEFLRALALRGLSNLKEARSARGKISTIAGKALLSGWQAKTILKQAVEQPEKVLTGIRVPSGILDSSSLSLRAITGWW
jgi:phytoene/squalene synthetase